jgi:hypothetical protein
MRRQTLEPVYFEKSRQIQMRIEKKPIAKNNRSSDDRLIIILDIYDSILNKWFYFVEIFDKSNENYELYEAYYNNELLLFQQKILQAS